ncbi:MAG: RNA helicase, partial [Actinomycetales bacterium]|nr:RNA helicase [Actinomycetales bacterium]
PTYNMAVNLVAQVGRTRAREVLEMSFAQFQADRGVVGLAREAKAHTEALEGYAKAMECHLGDFTEYAALRRRISDLEKAQRQDASRERRAETARALEQLRPGDVIQVKGGRRSGFAVVVQVGQTEGFAGPAPTVLGVDTRLRRLDARDLPGGIRTAGALALPKGFSARRPHARKDLAAALRRWLDERDPPARGKREPRGRQEHDDAEIAAARRALRAHPCHGCPDREDHARWAERWHKLDREHGALLRRIRGRTDSIARDFDRTCKVLARLGYLSPDREEVTEPGEVLRRVYAESDLLVAECLRRGVWEGLDAPALAGVVSAVVYEARREAAGAPHIPGGPSSALARALDETYRVFSELEDLETEQRLDVTGAVDPGIVEPVVRWAQGRGLDAVLRGGELAAGDFVRWCKQVIDLLDQLSIAAPTPRLRATASKAVGAVRRGVVAYSSL